MPIYLEEHRLFQKSVRRFCETELLPQLSAWEEQKYFPDEVFRKLGKEGFLGILVAEEDGGVGGDFTMAGAWCEEFGRVPAVGLTTGVNMHALVVTPALAKYGSEEAKKQFLHRAIEGTAIGAYAFTEPGAGSDLTQVLTRAVREDGGWRLNGTKIFITNGARADFVMVLAKTDTAERYDGYTTFVVDTSLSGFSVPRTLTKLGWHSSDTAELVLEDVLVPDSMVLGAVGSGWHQAMSSLEWERLMLSLGALGGAKACLEQTVTYTNNRKVFGKSVSSYDLTRETLASLWSQLRAAESHAHYCISLLNGKQRCRKEVSLNKLHTCELAIRVADTCLQLHGGYGYTTEFLPERWLRDLRLNTIGGGTSQVMARIAAKEVFSDLK